MRRLRRLGLAALALLVLAAALNWRHLAAFPGILPAFTAKEYCSCRFVMGQGDAYCRRYVAQRVPVGAILVDVPGRRVTARGTGAERRARWLSPREGCRLD